MLFNGFIQDEVFSGQLTDKTNEDRDLYIVEIKSDLRRLRTGGFG